MRAEMEVTKSDLEECQNQNTELTAANKSQSDELDRYQRVQEEKTIEVRIWLFSECQYLLFIFFFFLVVQNATVQSLYNTPHYYMYLDLTQLCCDSHFFYHGILQRNYRKMTIEWSFSYYSFVKLSFYKLSQFAYNLVHSYGPQI